MALIFLGVGFKPLIDAYLVKVSSSILFWANMVSAVLDNATLAAAETADIPGRGRLNSRQRSRRHPAD